ncbi:MAG: type III-A CRISPR-associated RAMP protein Csm4 [Bacteroidota bacterium]
MKAVYLTPHSSLSTELRSDTLWGLLLVAIRYVLGENKAEEIAKACIQGQPPFVISSAMRFIEEESKRICLLPRPILRPYPVDVNSEEDMIRLKKAKKQKTIPFEKWEKLINGEAGENQLVEELIAHATDERKQSGTFEEQDVLHIAVDRMSGKTLELDGTGQLFYTEELFVRGGGLFFLVAGDITLIEPALRYLEHVGFGGDISVGKGKCTVEIEDFTLRTPAQPTHMVTLSLYKPTDNELSFYRQSSGRLWYELEVRSGRLSPSTAFGSVATPEKKSVVAFAEGSTFPWRSQQTYGTVQTVAQWGTTNVLFNGFALMIPACFKEET